MDFNKIYDRRGTNAIKSDALLKHFGREDLIPLWIADMDFESPLCVKEALQRVVDCGIYGYNTIPKEYFPTIKWWLEQQQNWSVEQQWLTFIPGIVKGIGYAINHFTKEGDGIIIQPPVYPPFINVPNLNNRKVVYNPLVKNEQYAGGNSAGELAYQMDFEGLEQIGKSRECKMLVLSNPHNPGGIAWDRATLERLASICYKYGILVISDEIHADMPLFGRRHIPFATVSKEAEQISITFGAPSKTFNIAGIVSSYAVVPNEELRVPFYKWMEANELNSPTIFATTAAVAAYRNGNRWRKEMLEYLQENILFTEEFFSSIVADGIQLIQPIRPQSSFLVWLDCRELCRKFGMTHSGLVDLFVNKAGLALNSGAAFGPGGEGFMRLNIGSPRAILEKAFGQLKEQILKLG